MGIARVEYVIIPLLRNFDSPRLVDDAPLSKPKAFAEGTAP